MIAEHYIAYLQCVLDVALALIVVAYVLHSISKSAAVTPKG